MAKSETKFLRVDDLNIPVKLIREWRNSVRISIAKDRVNLRLPMWLPSSRQIQQNLDWAEDWLKNQFILHPELKHRFLSKTYEHGQTFDIHGQRFILKFYYEKRKTNTARILGNMVEFKINQDIDDNEKSRITSVLLSRVMAQFFHDEFKDRVLCLNQKYFQKRIGQIKLKYNKSNWGSCSARGNINLSTRLLFAPIEVQNYVILHELAHLVELNHSKSFWKLLSDIDPNYKEKEKWLKKNAYRCHF